jgi:hypothetical protein
MAEEADLEVWAIKQIKLKKGVTRKVKWICRRGAPDRLVWVPGWLWPELWELKAPGKKLEAHQKREHIKLQRMGVTCRKVDTREQVILFLNS